MNLIWHTTPAPKEYGAIRRCLIFKKDKWNGGIGIQIVECGTKSDGKKKIGTKRGIGRYKRREYLWDFLQFNANKTHCK